MKIAVTGHRPQSLGWPYDLKAPEWQGIDKKLREYAQPGVTGISGMALGIDTLWAIACLDAGIPLIVALPYPIAATPWPEEAKRTAERICAQAEVVILSDRFRYSAIEARNQWMVKHSDRLVAVWNGRPGGTANTVRYAQKLSKPIIRIDPKQPQSPEEPAKSASGAEAEFPYRQPSLW